jgi:hypothetical protein
MEVLGDDVTIVVLKGKTDDLSHDLTAPVDEDTMTFFRHWLSH